MVTSDLGSPPAEFRALSARLGADPLQIQGPGGNTSWKRDGTMWIKASGTQLADAEGLDIFVPVDLATARGEIDGAGDGTCRAAVLAGSLRPSIETTFHALLDAPVVVHTHSVAALAHVTSDEGEATALQKLEGLDAVAVPYRKPGLPLTHAIRNAVDAETRVILLRNHGLIVTGRTVADTDALIREVEERLALDAWPPGEQPQTAPEGWRTVDAFPLLTRQNRACLGSFWPDHVVFLGPGVARSPDEARPEQNAALFGDGAVLRSSAKPIAALMLRCLAEVLARVPDDWTMRPLGPDAEAELMDWDAETYRQKLAGASAP